MPADNPSFPTPSRQIIAAAAIGGVLIVVLVAAYLLLFRQSYAVLFNNLRQADAATIVAELDKKKVPYRLRDGGATILVPEKAVDSTRLSVMSADLPIKGMVGFELFNKSDMGLTEFAQRINYQRALQGELSRTIMTLEGVDTARVHLAITEPTIFRDDRKPPKASVTILPRPGRTLTADMVAGVQRLVAAAVPDLDVANVVVLNGKGAIISPTSAASSDASGQPGFGKSDIESYYAARIRAALAPSYPAEQIEATVIADIDAVDPADASTTMGVGAAAWSPDSRRFRLRVAVAVGGSLSPQAREDARTLAAEAIGYDDNLGDLITVTPYAPAQAAAPVPAAAAAPTWPAAAAAVTSPEGVSLPWALLAAVLLSLMGAAAFIVWRRRAGAAPLSMAQRERYVQKLKALLAEGEADVPLSA